MDVQVQAQKLWDLYCPTMEFDSLSPANIVTEKFMGFFREEAGRELIARSCAEVGDIAEKRLFRVKLDELVEHCRIPGVESGIRDRPEDTLRCMSLALHRLLLREHVAGDPPVRDDVKIHTRVLGYPAGRLKHLKANMINRFFAVKGTVISASLHPPSLPPTLRLPLPLLPPSCSLALFFFSSFCSPSLYSLRSMKICYGPGDPGDHRPPSHHRDGLCLRQVRRVPGQSLLAVLSI